MLLESTPLVLSVEACFCMIFLCFYYSLHLSTIHTLSFSVHTHSTLYSVPVFLYYLSTTENLSCSALSSRETYVWTILLYISIRTSSNFSLLNFHSFLRFPYDPQFSLPLNKIKKTLNQITEQSVADAEKPKKFGVSKVKSVVRGKKKTFSRHFFLFIGVVI